MSAFVKQVTDSISTVFQGTKRRRAFPRIQVTELIETLRHCQMVFIDSTDHCILDPL